MCGFVGVFPSLNKEKDQSIINQMLKNIKYRGPDETSFFRNNQIALGHHRLSIIDLKGGRQPVLDKESNDCLVFNGEIYGYKRHAKELREKGIKLNDLSDTEVLFKLLINFGIEKTLEKINGMFSFAYFKANENSVYLARDRAGEKPLYFAVCEKFLLFGSEIKTITDCSLFEKRLDYSAIADYLHLDYISQNKTLFNNIKKVKAGEYIKFFNNKYTTHSYWKFNQKHKKNLSEEEALTKLETLIKKVYKID